MHVEPPCEKALLRLIEPGVPVAGGTGVSGYGLSSPDGSGISPSNSPPKPAMLEPQLKLITRGFRRASKQPTRPKLSRTRCIVVDATATGLDLDDSGRLDLHEALCTSSAMLRSDEQCAQTPTESAGSILPIHGDLLSEDQQTLYVCGHSWPLHAPCREPGQLGREPGNLGAAADRAEQHRGCPR
jgi:hypothetical protein